MEDVAAPADQDPRRWVALAIAILSAFIVVLDNTVLNVAIPTILRDLDSTLPTLEWVITGYSLTFATFLIIGGRLGDVYGHRRVFIIGAALFGIGSLLAATSRSVGQLLIGEAVIEGLGASLLLPATLAILSSTFRGRERATAFAAWGATAGLAAACGPLVGGFLTTHFSWRWAFLINVIVAPLTIVGALLFIRPSPRRDERVRIDLPGAVLVAFGMFLLVFALSEGGRYGWWEPTKDFLIGSVLVWPESRAVSIVPVLFVVSAVLLFSFTRLELRKERLHQDPLFEFSHLRRRTYRYGLLTGVVVAMGQLGITFVLAVFLQGGRHLSAEQNGLWLLPMGASIVVGAQLGGRLVNRFGVTRIVRAGLFIDAVGIALVLRAVSLDMTAWQLIPGLTLYGLGIGSAGAQLTNVVLSEIPDESTGAASGANTSVRQVGNALGVAVIGTLLTTRTIATATARFDEADIPADVRGAALARLQELGSSFTPPPGTPAGPAAVLRSAVEHSLVTGTRTALAFALTVVAIGCVLSMLIPTSISIEGGEPPADGFEPVVPLDPDPTLRRVGAGPDQDAEGEAASWPSSSENRSTPPTAVGEAPEHPTLIPAARYTDPAFFALEHERLWPSVWQIACSVDHVSRPGDWFELRCGPLSVLIVRGDDGVLRAFQNVCRHRGNSLCQGSGTDLRELRCPFHRWAWDLRGELREVPSRRGFGMFRNDELPLLPVRVGEWGPLVFVSLDPDAVSLDEWLEGVPADAAWARLDEFRCVATTRTQVPCNWKAVADGFSETYHVQGLHPEMLGSIDDVHAPQRFWGRHAVSYQRYGVPSPRLGRDVGDQEVWDSFILTQGGRMGPEYAEPCPMPPIPEGEGVRDVIAALLREHQRQFGADMSDFDTEAMLGLAQYNLFPNVTVLLWSEMVNVLIARPGPVVDQAELVSFLLLRHTADAPRTPPADFEVPPGGDLGWVLNQDVSILRTIQAGLRQPGLTHLVLSNEERRIINMHRNLEAALGI